MASEKYGLIDVGKVEIPTSAQATEGQTDPRQNQPPYSTPNNFIGAGCHFSIDSGYKTDAESSHVESELKIFL